MSQALKGKVAVITGAGGRIGRGIVDKFLESGATVIGVDIIKSDIPNVDNVVVDLGNPESILQFEQYLREKHGSIDVVVNNGAVGGHRAPFHEKPLAEWDLVFNVNSRGPFLLMQSVIKLHLEAKRGGSRPLSIINITSTAGHKPLALGSIYGASKAALMSITKAAAKEYGKFGIRSNSVSPGFMEVPNVQGFKQEEIAAAQAAIPRGKPGSPRDIGNIVAWLAGDESLHANGTDFLIDGGELING